MVSINLRPDVLGVDETRSHPSYPIQLTEYDRALKALTKHLEESYRFDLINPRFIKLAGGLVAWLRRYMDQARRMRKPYRKEDWLSVWKPLWMNTYGYSEKQANEDIEVYFRIFRLEREKGNIGNAIYMPYAYTATHGDASGVGEVIRVAGKYVIIALAVYALARGIGGGVGSALAGKRRRVAV